MNFNGMNISQIKRMIENGESSAVEVCQGYLRNIERLDPRIKAFLHWDPDSALRQAARMDAWKREGKPLPPLAGVPLAIKDNILIRDQRCTSGSKILENFRALYHATVIERLEQAGAVFLGKTNLDEFAMGSSTENSGFFTTRNPHNEERVPGGSSGGSAAAVASGMALAALGSDTGGSIRQPAALCGVVGLKPTYSRVSRYGLVAYGSSLDQIGPISRSVEDAARILEVIAGFDPHDSTSSARPVEKYSEGLDRPIQGLKIGLPREYFGEGLSAEVKGRVEQGIRLLEQSGCE